MMTGWDGKPWSHIPTTGYKIDLIKRFRLGAGVGLREAKDCIEALWEGKGIHDLPFPVGHTYVPERIEEFRKEVVHIKFLTEVVLQTRLGKLLYT